MSSSAPYRVALYYAPDAADPLWSAGTRWLGRDPESGERLTQPPGIGGELTKEAEGYGLHATLKPPMRLTEGRSFEAFHEAASRLARSLRPFTMPPLSVQNLHGFLALRESQESAALQALADVTVATLEPFRAPLNPAELEKRRRHGLSAAESAMVEGWGYPYVFQLWQFHITLSRRLSEAEMAWLKPEAAAYFAPALAEPRQCRSLALFTQAEKGGPFRLAARLPFAEAPA